MHDRSEWTRGTAGPKVIGSREYKNLIDFSRPCAACGEPFSIYVTAKIANGHADSNSFALKNCPQHRRNRSAADNNELETLRTANVTMREELTGLYEQVRLQFEELQVAKAKLAKYELAPLMAAEGVTRSMELLPFGEGAGKYAGIGCEAVQNTSNGALPKHPWEA